MKIVVIKSPKFISGLLEPFSGSKRSIIEPLASIRYKQKLGAMTTGRDRGIFLCRALYCFISNRALTFMGLVVPVEEISDVLASAEHEEAYDSTCECDSVKQNYEPHFAIVLRDHWKSGEYLYYSEEKHNK